MDLHNANRIIGELGYPLNQVHRKRTGEFFINGPSVPFNTKCIFIGKWADKTNDEWTACFLEALEALPKVMFIYDDVLSLMNGKTVAEVIDFFQKTLNPDSKFAIEYGSSYDYDPTTTLELHAP